MLSRLCGGPHVNLYFQLLSMLLDESCGDATCSHLALAQRGATWKVPAKAEVPFAVTGLRKINVFCFACFVLLLKSQDLFSPAPRKSQIAFLSKFNLVRPLILHEEKCER